MKAAVKGWSGTQVSHFLIPLLLVSHSSSSRPFPLFSHACHQNSHARTNNKNKNKLQTVSHFVSDTIVSHFCSLILSPKAVTSRESEIQQMICAFLVDCASRETIECLHCLMELERRAKQAREGHNSLSLWQLKLAISASQFCHSMRGFFVEGLRNYIDSKVKGALLLLMSSFCYPKSSLTSIFAHTCISQSSYFGTNSGERERIGQVSERRDESERRAGGNG
jgi:hypothetical protein